MKERPILFSGEMVRAILEGRKTQTRRVVKPDIADCIESGLPMEDQRVECDDGPMGGTPLLKFCPYGEPGTKLWVRETWNYATDPFAVSVGAAYKADGTARLLSNADPSLIPNGATVYNSCAENFPANIDKWKPSIFMPRWASRITLEILAVRAERIQDITESDAIAEGIADPAEIAHLRAITEKAGLQYCPHKMAYSELWDELNEERGFGWDTNCWVWVVEFRRIE